MKLDRLLGSLEKVRSTGNGTWTARCPAHEDKHPSLSIREVDGQILIHCFTGCDVYDIVKAVGMELDDLFSEKPEYHSPISRPFPATAVLRCLISEITFLQVCAHDLMQGESLTKEDHERLKLACQRIDAAVVGGML